jgi:putative ABC transport system ATP-binding protein
MLHAPGSTLIRTEGLNRRYRMGRETIEALRGVSVEVRQGEYTAIVGPSGSGKSTLMNIVGCLDTPDEGRYWLNGVLVSEMRDSQLAHVRNREIGFIFQTFALLPRATALQNVELPLVYARGQLERGEKLLGNDWINQADYDQLVSRSRTRALPSTTPKSVRPATARS